MYNVGFATLQIIPSARGFQGALNKGINPAVTSTGKTAGVAMGGSMKTGILGSLKGIAGPLAAIFGAKAVFGQLKSAVNEASNLGESVNAVQVVFGKASGGILELGNNAAKAVGLSKTEFNGLAVQFSNFASTVAGPGGNVVKTMQDLTGRASDFASVMNLDVAEAATLFQSGLAGQTEPLRKYGTDMSAAAVEAYALSEGIVSSKDELTESAKVQARYALLMDATAKTQGDFANTSDSLANRQRILSSQWKNAKASLGAGLLPIMERATGVVMTLFDSSSTLRRGISGLISGFKTGEVSTTGFVGVMQNIGSIIGHVILPAVRGFIESARQMFEQFKQTEAFATFQSILSTVAAFVRDNVQPILIGFGVAFAALGLPVLFGLITGAVGALTGALALLFSPVILITVGIAALVAGVIIAYNKFETFRNIVDTVLGFITGTVLPGLKTFASWLIQTVPPIVQRIAEVFLSAFTSIRETVTRVIDYVREKFTQFMGWAAPTWEMFTVLLSRVVSLAWGLIKGYFQIGFGIITAVIKVGWAVISSVFKVASGLIGTVVSAAWTLIKGVISGGMKIIGGIIRTVLALITGNWGQAWEGIKQVLRGAWEMIKAAVSAGITLLLGIFRDLPGNILSSLGNLASTLFSAGTDVIGGFIRGLRSMASSIIKAIIATVGDLPGMAKRLLGIESPSRVFGDLGEGVGLGFAAQAEALTSMQAPAPAHDLDDGDSAATSWMGRTSSVLAAFEDLAVRMQSVQSEVRRQVDRQVEHTPRLRAV